MSSHPALTAEQKRTYVTVSDLPSREAIADKMWSESCIELARIRDMLEPAFTRHQKALDALQAHGRDSKYPGMGKLLTEAWREFQVQRQVEAERTKGR